MSDPGDKWNYGPGARVLGTIIEKITGASLEAYYQQRIFQPLGMVDTSYAVPTAKQSRVPIVYSRVNGHLQASPSLITSTPTPHSMAMAASTPPRRITASSSRCCSTAVTWGQRES